ncbi:hypothetical protein, partial [Variovorax sp. KBW07]|uniref:hypothetical protein n=1 Tax=Variovorax sp. KBW07 TaxID=2153358 RepID=UPI001C896EF7
MTHCLVVCRVVFGSKTAVVQGDAHADGVLCSANVPRFAPPLFRCAEHTIRVSVIRVVVDQRYT